MPHYVPSGYLKSSVHPGERRKVTRRVLKQVREAWNTGHLPDFDAMAVSGYSGALMVGPVAERLNKQIIVARKTTDDCHGGKVEGVLAGEDSWGSGIKVEVPDRGHPLGFNYVIFDDFISMGNTVRRIHNDMEAHRAEATLVGIVLWNASPEIYKFMIDKIVQVPVVGAGYGRLDG